MDTIAERIKKGLLIRNMKQADLVEKTGIGKSSISTYLSGEYEPKQRNIYKIAQALDVNEAWLMGYDVPMERKIAIEVSEEEKNLLADFRVLNNVGQDKAIDYVSDLADNPKYQKEDCVHEPEIPYVPEVLAAHRPDGKPTEADIKDKENILKIVAEEKRKKGLL